MSEDARVEAALAILRPHYSEIEAWFHEQNARFIEIMESDHDALGRVLKAHLAVERFLTEFLEAQLGADELAAARLSFHKKASLLPSSGSPASFVKPGILALNRIRNAFAHDPTASIDPTHLQPVTDALRVMRPGVSFAEPVSEIEEFAAAASAFLLVSAPHIREVLEEAIANYQRASGGGADQADESSV